MIERPSTSPGKTIGSEATLSRSQRPGSLVLTTIQQMTEVTSNTAKGSTTIRRKYTMKIAAAIQSLGPRSILRGLNPLPVMVAYLLPRLDRRETKYTPMVVITSKVIPYAEARPIWLG